MKMIPLCFALLLAFPIYANQACCSVNSVRCGSEETQQESPVCERAVSDLDERERAPRVSERESTRLLMNDLMDRVNSLVSTMNDHQATLERLNNMSCESMGRLNERLVHIENTQQNIQNVSISAIDGKLASLLNMYAQLLVTLEKALADLLTRLINQLDDDHGIAEIKQKLAILSTNINGLTNIIEKMNHQMRVALGTLGDPSDASQSFTSVEDIDNAHLSIISWMKTIYREQRAQDFIS